MVLSLLLLAASLSRAEEPRREVIQELTPVALSIYKSYKMAPCGTVVTLSKDHLHCANTTNNLMFKPWRLNGGYFINTNFMLVDGVLERISPGAKLTLTEVQLAFQDASYDWSQSRAWEEIRAAAERRKGPIILP